MDWTFEACDFRDTLARLTPEDLVYADPPYAGRHVDYFNSWSDADEDALASRLSSAPCDFVLSTWHSNEFRKNAAIERVWDGSNFYITLRKHFYHVGSTEDLRHPMIEALITNFPATEQNVERPPSEQPCLFTLDSAKAIQPARPSAPLISSDLR